jgi:hypothetical protein
MHNNTAANFASHRAGCQAVPGGDLVSFNSQEEQAAVESSLRKVGAGNIWIGVIRVNNTWFLADGTFVGTGFPSEANPYAHWCAAGLINGIAGAHAVGTWLEPPVSVSSQPSAAAPADRAHRAALQGRGLLEQLRLLAARLYLHVPALQRVHRRPFHPAPADKLVVLRHHRQHDAELDERHLHCHGKVQHLRVPCQCFRLPSCSAASPTASAHFTSGCPCWQHQFL